MSEKVFISHSSSGRTYPDGSPTRAALLRDLLSEELRQRNYDVFLDRADIPPGQEWRDEVLTALDACRFFVVLLDRSALESHQVLRETHVAISKRLLRQSTQVIPVFLDDVRSQDVRNRGFTDIDLLQAIRLDAAGTAEQDAAALALKVLLLFPELPPTRHPADERWIELLGDQLVNATTRARGRGAEKLEISAHLCAAAQSATGDLLLARHLLDHHEKKHVVAAVSELRWAMPPENLDQLIRLLHPVWVDRTSARRLRPPDGTPLPRAALNASLGWVGRHYLEVAFCFDDMLVTVSEIGVQVGEDARESLTDQLLKHTKAVVPRAKGKCYLVVLAPRIRRDLVYTALDELHCRYPDVAAIVLFGKEGAAEELDPLADGVEEDAENYFHHLNDFARNRRSA